MFLRAHYLLARLLSKREVDSKFYFSVFTFYSVNSLDLSFLCSVASKQRSSVILIEKEFQLSKSICKLHKITRSTVKEFFESES